MPSIVAESQSLPSSSLIDSFQILSDVEYRRPPGINLPGRIQKGKFIGPVVAGHGNVHADSWRTASSVSASGSVRTAENKKVYFTGRLRCNNTFAGERGSE